VLNPLLINLIGTVQLLVKFLSYFNSFRAENFAVKKLAESSKLRSSVNKSSFKLQKQELSKRSKEV
jgi:hypothetical protein